MTAYDLRISDWSSDVCSSDLSPDELGFLAEPEDLRDLYRRLRFGAYDPGARPRASSEPRGLRQIGRAACRERVCQYVYISVVAVTLKKTTNILPENPMVHQ